MSEKPRSWNEIRNASVEFVRRFQDETDENAEAQSFWNEFLGMFGIDRRRVNAIFEDRAYLALGRSFPSPGPISTCITSIGLISLFPSKKW